jgi:mono/diheme cytochrome c family protein
MRRAGVALLLLLPPVLAGSPADRAGASPRGADLFDAHCGICHMPHGAGTIALAHRLGDAQSLLAERTDLDAAGVKYVVRNGIGSMPPQTRVDLSDAELEAVAAFLTRANGHD